MFRNPTTDLIVVLVIILLILGPKRLPGLGRSLGQGMREFKDSITGDSKDDDQDKPAITQSAAITEPTRSGESDRAAAPDRGVAPDRGSTGVGSDRRS